MTTDQLLVQTGLTFVAAILGAIFGAFLARHVERFKHLQELRSTAYADFLRGFAKVARAQADGLKDERSKLEQLDGRLAVADSRARIAIYGSDEVLRSLANFIRNGTQTLTPEGMQSFAQMCALMRSESVQHRAAIEDISTILFS